ncbi:MAG TPA: GGDEF domain-containing protein, partial [Solirubrobacteraceae bacterium]|nr:GGDEF domain-containing protein [Solirubrobacteraceae bacterium]
LLALALGRLAITTVLVGTAVTGGGTFMACAGFVWLAVWAAVFFSRGELILMLGAEAASTVAGVALNQDPVRTASDAAPLLFASALLSVLLLGIIGNLRNQARRDHLTGLLNRHGLEQALDDPLGPQRGSRPTSLVAIDIDGLKEVNDVGGHLAGDQLLVEFATELTRASRSADLPARIGGDEFLIILCDTCATGATSWADRLRAGSQLSWSFGVAERGEDEPLESWLARADQGMYAAKRAGRQVTSQLARAAG